MVTSIKSNQHYCNPDLISRITSGLQKMGKSTETVTMDDFSFIFRAQLIFLQIKELINIRQQSQSKIKSKLSIY